MTFRQLHSIINPANSQDEFTVVQQQAILKRLRSGGCKSVDELLRDMCFLPRDWTLKEKREIAKKLNLPKS